MRKLKIYFQLFWPTIVLVAGAVLVWIYVPENLGEFKGTLLGTLFGVGISLAATENLKKLAAYKRVKRTFGFLKLITTPYLKNQADNLSDTMRQYQDMCTVEQAMNFFAIAANINRIAENFDKSWLQLVYSQDFIDAINSDEHFNKIANTIFEVLLFSKQLSAQSVNAQVFLLNNLATMTDEQKQNYLERAQQTRNDLINSAEKLRKYTEALQQEISRFLDASGAVYSEFER